MSTRPRMGMPSNVNWPVMGGPTAHPTGATLALGDPPRSLNASGESLSYLPGRGAQGFAPWVVLERFPGPVVTAGAAVMYGRGSGSEVTLLITEKTSRRSPIWLPAGSAKIGPLIAIIEVWRVARGVQGWLCHSQGW